jgi:prophage regulatory protein
MDKPKSSGALPLTIIPECAIKPDCSATVFADPAVHGSQGAKTDRLAPTTRDVRSQPIGDEFWSIRVVALKTGLSRASIYRYAARNLFPARRRIGPGRVAWLASEVLAWMESRPRPNLRGENPTIRAHPTDCEE